MIPEEIQSELINFYEMLDDLLIMKKKFSNDADLGENVRLFLKNIESEKKAIKK